MRKRKVQDDPRGCSNRTDIGTPDDLDLGDKANDDDPLEKKHRFCPEDHIGIRRQQTRVLTQSATADWKVHDVRHIAFLWLSHTHLLPQLVDVVTDYYYAADPHLLQHWL